MGDLCTGVPYTQAYSIIRQYATHHHNLFHFMFEFVHGGLGYNISVQVKLPTGFNL